MSKKKYISLGVDDFKELITENYYFVDKSLFIKELIDLHFKVFLILRPRRFGKTMHLSMLKYFFDITENNKTLFNHLAILQAGELYTQHQQSYPVIFMTLKDVKAKNWQEHYDAFISTIAAEYKRHDYLSHSSKLSEKEKQTFHQLLNEEAPLQVVSSSLQLLSEYLEKHHEKKVYILIDEYDSPIHDAHYYGYANQLLTFMRDLLGKALKGNLSLKQAVVTGILRIGKESLFSGVNNLTTCTVLDEEFSNHFAWTTQDVEKILTYFQLTTHTENLKKWYDGYTCGTKKNLYNPWSVLNFIGRSDRGFRSYWANTGNPEVLRHALAKSSGQVKLEIEQLLNGKTLNYCIDESLTLLDFAQSRALWTLLLFSGYLTALGDGISPENNIWPLRIPNFEVKQALGRIIESWFSEESSIAIVHKAILALGEGEIEAFRLILTDYIEKVLSYFDVKGDEPERFYHALVLGMLVVLQDTHTILSNRESGYGRYDVMLIPHNKHKVGIIIEFKKISKSQNITLEQAITQAFQQIEEKNYQQTLKTAGIKKITMIAIAFFGKDVLIEVKNNTQLAHHK